MAERARAAVSLVMHDVEGVVRKDVVQVVVDSGDDLEAALRIARPSWPARRAHLAGLNGHVLKANGGETWLTSGKDVDWERYVVQVADVIQ
jgi:hypothetical protein